ncbi:conidiation protein 6 [Trichophaea hybrida]|nr:conidiation protein 6 [Trichophaea hybrida]
MSSGNPGNVIGGHKAALKNPNVSEEAKEHSRQVLDQIGDQTDSSARATAGSDPSNVSTEGKNTGNVVGGYKATLKNPNVSDEAKDHAEKVLEEMGAK